MTGIEILLWWAGITAASFAASYAYGRYVNRKPRGIPGKLSIAVCQFCNGGRYDPQGKPCAHCDGEGLAREIVLGGKAFRYTMPALEARAVCDRCHGTGRPKGGPSLCVQCGGRGTVAVFSILLDTASVVGIPCPVCEGIPHKSIHCPACACTGWKLEGIP